MNQKFTPTLRQLRAFLAVYQLRKLSAAADQLFVTQSAVSVLIRQMEEGLGVRLFDRTTRSLQATQAAQEAVVVAERILRDVDALGAGLRDLTGLRRGRVCIAITPTLADIMLPRVIRRFAASYPSIQVAIDDCAPNQFAGRVTGEHVDFGIGTPERAGVDVDTRTLLRDHLSLICTPEHPLAHLKTLRWVDLAGHQVITMRPGYGIRPMVEAAATQAGVALQVASEVSFLSTALWMTHSGLGASIMPSAFATYSRHSDLIVKTLTAPRVSRDVFIVTRRGRSLSPACHSFIDMLLAEFAAKKPRARKA